METYSFSLVIPNLFIGLSKGSRVLRPYSKEFGIKLSYKLQRLEPRMVINPGELVNPDAICSSSFVGNTIIMEWTEADNANERKERQLEKYSHMNSQNVIGVISHSSQ